MRNALVAAALALAAAGTANGAGLPQDALHPAGPQAEAIHRLWDLMLLVCSIVLVAVVVAMLAAVARGRRADNGTPPDVAALDRDERTLRRVVASATGLTALVLMGLLAASVMTDRALARLPLEDAIHIKLVGHQWWWEAVYDDPQPSRLFSTANELHIPVGRTVMFSLEAGDVIHSLWIPNLHGKKDLIPGNTTTLALRADVPGVYRGQCAEFCGYQHAKMALLVIAEAPDDYERWADRQRQPAPPPSDGLVERGKQVLETASCSLCHTVSGSIAQGRTGPDLTHVASRTTLASGFLPNTPENRAAWIQDPQQFKPGNQMPANALPPADLQALLAYLGTLQ